MEGLRTEWVVLQVEGGAMRCFVVRPATAPRGGLVLFQEAFGVNEHIRDVAQRFAREGYLVIAPELYHRTAPGFESGYDNLGDDPEYRKHMAALTDQGLVADAKAAYEWLEAQDILKGRIGAVGYCMGGRTAFLANTEFPLAAAISYYGGRIAPALLPRAKDSEGPLLLIWGARDASIPPEQIAEVTKALDEAGKVYESKVFPDGGHGFFCDVRASYHEPSAKEAWALTLNFLEKYIS